VKLALGTAQFGAAYGIAGAGPLSEAEAELALRLAAEAGIDTLDTAAVYGDSETVIGRSPHRADFRIVTKLPPVTEREPRDFVRRSVASSLERLRVERVHGLLVHRADDLLGVGGDALWSALAALRGEGLVKCIGASVYGPDELATLNERYGPDLVQLPLNVLDQRVLSSGLLPAMRAAGTEIHARSPFLQGLLVMPAGQRPAWTARWQPELAAVDDWVEASGLPAEGACLQFALRQEDVDRVVVGIDGTDQLKGLLEQSGNMAMLPPADPLACNDEDLILPCRWPT